MSFLLPAVCSTFKGISPSDFAERWGHPQVGRARMELDATIASEINEQLSENYQKSDRDSSKASAGDAKGAVARRNQRRAERRKREGGI